MNVLMFVKLVKSCKVIFIDVFSKSPHDPSVTIMHAHEFRAKSVLISSSYDREHDNRKLVANSEGGNTMYSR